MSGNPVIGLIMATPLEAAPFIRELSLQPLESRPFAVHGNDRFAMILSGIGKANAAMACAYLIQTRRPSLICNLGAAGAVDRRTRLGESYLIERVIEPDRPDLRSGLPRSHSPALLEGFAVADLATHDRPLRDPQERECVAASVHLVDMEGAAVAQACRRFGVRCFVFKFVSDTPDHRLNTEIIQNIERYRDAHARFFTDSVLPLLLPPGR
ncbi:MAG: hypothetical protein AB1558_02790 [Thermodesulfobacteriota bacterium]